MTAICRQAEETEDVMTATAEMEDAARETVAEAEKVAETEIVVENQSEKTKI